jgi:hypothetical protein
MPTDEIEPASSQKQTERLPVFPPPPDPVAWPEGTERMTERLIQRGYAIVCDPAADGD